MIRPTADREPVQCPDCGNDLPPHDEWDGLLTHCPSCDCPLWAAVAAGFVQFLSEDTEGSR